MKKFTNKELVERLRAIDIHNPHNLCQRFGRLEKDDVWIEFYAGSTRATTYSRTNVLSPNYKTDPEAHWTNYGAKSFSGKITESLPKAVAWATEEYKIKEWVRSPFDPRGQRIPKTVLDRAIAYLTVPPPIPHSEELP